MISPNLEWYEGRGACSPPSACLSYILCGCKSAFECLYGCVQACVCVKSTCSPCSSDPTVPLGPICRPVINSSGLTMQHFMTLFGLSFSLSEEHSVEKQGLSLDAEPALTAWPGSCLPYVLPFGPCEKVRCRYGESRFQSLHRCQQENLW